MFLQIKLLQKDKKYHRILWRENPNDEILELEFNSHPFGSRSSPCVAMFTTHEHARDHSDKFPRAAETIIETNNGGTIRLRSSPGVILFQKKN